MVELIDDLIVSVITVNEELKEIFLQQEPLSIGVRINYFFDNQEVILENKEGIHQLLKQTDILIILLDIDSKDELQTALIVSDIAKKLNISFTVVIAFDHTEKKSKENEISYRNSLTILKANVGALFIIPTFIYQSTPVKEAVNMTKNEVIMRSFEAVTNPVTMAAIPCVDPSYVELVFDAIGTGRMGVGQAQGENRAKLAAEKALSVLSYQGVSTLKESNAAYVTIFCGADFLINEIDVVGETVVAAMNNQEMVHVAAVIKNKFIKGEFVVSIIS